MKKLVVVLLLLGFITPLFADDALMIPQNVIRFRLIPSATFASKTFDDDGERQDGTALADSASQYNLSFALEYGVTDWVTAALQWTPGWNYYTNLEDPVLEDAQVKGLYDLFVGAKVQIVGEKAPVVNDRHRFALAAGAIVPLSTYDAEEEVDAFNDGDEFRPQRTSNDAWGIGGRLYYDYVVNPSFFINLYNETIFFLPRELDVWGPPSMATLGKAVLVEDVEYDYGYKATFELEPQYETMINDGLRFGAGLPVTYVTKPEVEIEGEGQDNASYTLTLGPNVSFFFLDGPWPIDLELQFRTDVLGKNAVAQNSVVLQIKNYLRFW